MGRLKKGRGKDELDETLGAVERLDLLVEVRALLETGLRSVLACGVTVPDLGFARLRLGLELLLPLALLGVVGRAENVGTVQRERSDRRRDVRSC